MDYETLFETLKNQFSSIIDRSMEDTGNDIGLVTMTAPKALEAAIGELMDEYYK